MTDYEITVRFIARGRQEILAEYMMERIVKDIQAYYDLEFEDASIVPLREK